MHRNVTHAQPRRKQCVLDGVRDIVPFPHAHVARHTNLNVDQVAQPALADAASVKVCDSRDAGRYRPNGVLQLGRHRDVHDLIEGTTEDLDAVEGDNGGRD